MHSDTDRRLLFAVFGWIRRASTARTWLAFISFKYTHFIPSPPSEAAALLAKSPPCTARRFGP